MTGRSQASSTLLNPKSELPGLGTTRHWIIVELLVGSGEHEHLLEVAVVAPLAARETSHALPIDRSAPVQESNELILAGHDDPAKLLRNRRRVGIIRFRWIRFDFLKFPQRIVGVREQLERHAVDAILIVPKPASN